LPALILALLLVACDRGSQVPAKVTPVPVAVTLETLQAETFNRWLILLCQIHSNAAAALRAWDSLACSRIL
jgi:hypothetical protein